MPTQSLRFSTSRTDYVGNLRRHFFYLSSKAVSHHRRSAQALLTLAPSTQVAQSRSCSPFQQLIIICLLFGSAVQKLSTLHDHIQGDQVGSQGTQTGSPQNILFQSQGRFFSQYGVALALSKENLPSRLLPNLCSFIPSSTRPYL